MCALVFVSSSVGGALAVPSTQKSKTKPKPISRFNDPRISKEGFAKRTGDIDSYYPKVQNLVTDVADGVLAKYGEMNEAAVKAVIEGLGKGLDTAMVDEFRWWSDGHNLTYTDDGTRALKSFLENSHKFVLPESPQAVKIAKLPALPKRWQEAGVVYAALDRPLWEGDPKPSDFLEYWPPIVPTTGYKYGDCYLLAFAGSEAHVRPDKLKQMIRKVHVDDDGQSVKGWTVRMYARKDGLHDPTPVDIYVPNQFPTKGGKLMLDHSPNDRVLLPAVLQMAYVIFKGGFKNAGAGDVAMPIITAFTGKTGTSEHIFADSDLDKLYGHIEEMARTGYAMAASTMTSDKYGNPNRDKQYEGSRIEPDDEYSVLGAYRSSGHGYIRVRQVAGKYGKDGYRDLPIEKFAKYFAVLESVPMN